VQAIDSSRPLAFAFGYLCPTVAVSMALVRALDDRELFAVLLHEAEHVRRRDPLRVLVVAVVSKAFLFAPLIASLAERFKEAKEIDADQAVIRAMGSRDALVSALLAAAAYEPLGAAAGFADALSARIAALEGEEPASVGVGWRATAGTALTFFVLAAGLFVIATGAVDAHALHICG
jgi:beta-lactamase regulating signal transducer with metallopeptidase domain